GEQFCNAVNAHAPRKTLQHQFVFLNVHQEGGKRGTFKHRAFLRLYAMLFGGATDHFAHEIAVVADVAVHFAAAQAIERRLRNVNVAALDQFAQEAEKKIGQQRANVAAVHVGVGHQDNLVITQFGGIEIVLADAGAKRGDDGPNFFVAQHLVVARFFDV